MFAWLTTRFEDVPQVAITDESVPASTPASPDAAHDEDQQKHASEGTNARSSTARAVCIEGSTPLPGATRLPASGTGASRELQGDTTTVELSNAGITLLAEPASQRPELEIQDESRPVSPTGPAVSAGAAGRSPEESPASVCQVHTPRIDA